ncbi:MAG: hypothetical protein D3M94_04140 [Rhodocyclales bacterium GT-UBC]|nr:MAG: hypothetical protein D3M94_04140 [Rhodocyclales bacterium GT-UBC]
MDEIPEQDLEETRAALAPTLEATAAILPWVAKPAKLRFDARLNARWIDSCRRLAEAWTERHGKGAEDIRPAIFALYAIALESADADCLHLGEALASAADSLEEAAPTALLTAALSAATECFNEPGGLENILFPERARHFAQRIEKCLENRDAPSIRSPIIDRLFVSEAYERIERMQDALAALPPDAYSLKLESTELAQQAEHLELYGIVHLCRQLENTIPVESRIDELDSFAVRESIERILHQLIGMINAITS